MNSANFIATCWFCKWSSQEPNWRKINK